MQSHETHGQLIHNAAMWAQTYPLKSSVIQSETSHMFCSRILSQTNKVQSISCKVICGRYLEASIMCPSLRVYQSFNSGVMDMLD